MTVSVVATDAAREARVRRSLAKDGYALQKSRARNWTLDNQGMYRVIDPFRNIPMTGFRFDATLEEVEAWTFNGE